MGDKNMRKKGLIMFCLSIVTIIGTVTALGGYTELPFCFEIECTYDVDNPIECIIESDDYGVTDDKLIIDNEPIPDTPPQIFGVQTLKVRAGDTILFLHGITAKDAFGNILYPYVVTHNVNHDVPGVYSVTYAAEDSWGLRTEVTVDVYVLQIDPEHVIAMVNDLLAHILRDDMTQLEQARTIFSWVRNNVRYVGDANRRSLYEAAYQALRHRRGDCFSFYAVTELMLTQAGIPNMRVTRVGGASEHFWNLINPDNLGWHHLDTSPHDIRVQNLNRFMFTASQAAAHTAYIYRITGRTNYYTHDPYHYPDIAP